MSGKVVDKVPMTRKAVDKSPWTMINRLHAKRFWALSPYLPRSTEGRVGERCELTENRATSCLTAHGASVCWRWRSSSACQVLLQFCGSPMVNKPQLASASSYEDLGFGGQKR